MGCCVSTNNTSLPPKTSHISNSKSSTEKTGISKSPPPTCPLPEEETVKEVLSETPTIPKDLAPTIAEFHENHQSESQFIKTEDEKKHYLNGTVFKNPLTVLGNDELSEVASEICCTASDSVIVSKTITEKKESNGDGNEEFHEARRRSPARSKNRSFSAEVKREKTVGQSPGRRSEPSSSRNRPGPGYFTRRDSEESSGRSASPVMRADSGSSKMGLGGSPSRKTDTRVGPGLGERIRKVDEGKESGENAWPQTSNESLENPLVSLECFIFL